jgi:hypothetical protein
MNITQSNLFRGAIKSFVAGATGVVVALNVVDYEHFNVTSFGGLKHLGMAVLIAGLVSEARFLNQWAHSGNGNGAT